MVKPAPGLAQAPALTLPPEEAEALAAVYGAAGVILEYGSGGSTALAADMAGKAIFSVESDADWAAGMQAWFDSHPPRARRLVIHHVDIGPTAKWGNPADSSGWTRYHRYPFTVWSLPRFEHPDAVLIDGRFRVACFLAVLFSIERPVTVLWDDYTVRPRYHVVERLAQPSALHGRMARFDLTPQAVRNRDLPWIIDQFNRKL